MSNSSDVTSPITNAQIHFGNIFARYCTIPGTSVCFLVLVVCSFAACFPRSRQYMNRVSFRLLIYSLISHVLFGIAFAAAPISPGALCVLAAFSINLFVCFSTFCTTCIAINLQLVVVHHINGQRMEKYYLIGSTLLCLALNVPALALGQFGWNDTSSTCWYKNPDNTIRLHWMIATESCPLALAATIETVCSCILLVYMYLVQRSTEALFVPFILSSIRSISRATDLNYAERQRVGGPVNNIAQHPRYRKAILRIVLYPIISLLINFITLALDLYSTLRGVDTQMKFRLHMLDLSLVGVRTLPYGFLAAFDPALTNAVRELLGKNKSRSEKVSNNAPMEFAENPQLPGTASTTSRAEAQSRSDMELTSLGERILIVRENVEDGEGVEKMGQDLENVEFPMIERQL